MLSRDRMAEPPSADSVGIALDSKQGSAQGRLFIVRRCNTAGVASRRYESFFQSRAALFTADPNRSHTVPLQAEQQEWGGAGGGQAGDSHGDEVEAL